MALTDRHFDSWAIWVHQGGIITPSTSMLGVLIDTKGVMPRGEGGSKPLHLDCIESDIEALAMRLAVFEPKPVVILRLEFGATWISRLRDSPTQADKAHAIGVSLRTYQRHLQRAKTFINTHLEN